eukprot:2418259-Amphidinium_carterae.1
MVAVAIALEEVATAVPMAEVGQAREVRTQKLPSQSKPFGRKWCCADLHCLQTRPAPVSFKHYGTYVDGAF